MRTVTSEQEISLGKDQAWEKLSDLSKATDYVPGLTQLQFTTDSQVGVGASRRVTQGKSLQLDETVEAWEEGARISLRLHRGDKGAMPPFKHHYFDYCIESRGERVFIVNSMRYEVGLGWLGALLDKLALAKVMQSQLNDVTLAQKLYYESGDKVTADVLKAAKQALGR